VRQFKARRASSFFAWGVLATLAMSVPMLVGSASGISPMPKPIPPAIAAHVFGEATPRPLLIGLAFGSHLLYGGAWAALLGILGSRATVWHALALGALLWVVMGLVVLPWLGWGLFGLGLRSQIALATLLLHVVYGVTLGWLATQQAARRFAARTA
jgi:hypothetical protein